MGSWDIPMKEHDYGLDLFGVIVGAQLKVADAPEVIKADVMEEIKRSNRGCSATDFVIYFSENFPRFFTQKALLIAECLAGYYRTGEFFIYEYVRENCDPVEHRIRLFAVTEEDLKLLLDELQSVQNPEYLPDIKRTYIALSTAPAHIDASNIQDNPRKKFFPLLVEWILSRKADVKEYAVQIME